MAWTKSESEALLAHTADEGFWFRAKEDIVGNALAFYVRPDSTVLVLGVGNGLTVRRLRQRAPDCAVTGLDADAAAIDLCSRDDPKGTYRVCDLEVDPMAASGTVDVVIALDLVEHLRDDAGFVARVARCLKPGGVFAVNVPAHQWMFSQHDVNAGHLRRYAPRAIERLMRTQGLDLVHSSPLFMTVMAIVVLWRFGVQRLVRVGMDKTDMWVRLPDPLERFLYSVSMLESKVKLPIGLSHFLIARKP